jgi:hypothetical protein
LYPHPEDLSEPESHPTLCAGMVVDGVAGADPPTILV